MDGSVGGDLSYLRPEGGRRAPARCEVAQTGGRPSNKVKTVLVGFGRLRGQSFLPGTGRGQTSKGSAERGDTGWPPPPRPMSSPPRPPPRAGPERRRGPRRTRWRRRSRGCSAGCWRASPRSCRSGRGTRPGSGWTRRRRPWRPSTRRCGPPSWRSPGSSGGAAWPTSGPSTPPRSRPPSWGSGAAPCSLAGRCATTPSRTASASRSSFPGAGCGPARRRRRSRSPPGPSWCVSAARCRGTPSSTAGCGRPWHPKGRPGPRTARTAGCASRLPRPPAAGTPGRTSCRTRRSGSGARRR